MYRALLQSGNIECERYERTDNGVELYDADSFVAFVPYENLLAIVDESTGESVDRSIL